MNHIDFREAGMTQQQSDIIHSAIAAKAKGLKCSPAEIQNFYEKSTGKIIQRSNLFTQLKILSGASFLTKQNGEYFVNVSALLKSIENRKTGLAEKMERLDEQIKEIEKIKSESSLRQALPVLQYISPEKYFNIIAGQMKDAETIFVNSVYPWISLGYPLAEATGALDYCVQIRRLCEKNELEVNYLSSFNCEYLAGIALRAAKGDRKIALRECLKALENMRSQLKLHENLKIKFIPKGLDLHFIILKPKGGGPHSIYFYIYTGHGEIASGVVINSIDMAKGLCKIFERDFKDSFDMGSPRAGNIYKILERQFRNLLFGKNKISI